MKYRIAVVKYPSDQGPMSEPKLNQMLELGWELIAIVEWYHQFHYHFRVGLGSATRSALPWPLS